MEKISIVIPAFNASKYLSTAIDSALGQTYADIEVVVIDDGSTDDSVAILRGYGDRIRWETVPNAGGGAARNRGVRLATGNWIQFLDADDWLHSRKLELQYDQASASTDTLVFCDGEYSEPGQVHPHHRRQDDLSDPVVYMLRGGLPTPAPLHRRKWIESVGGFRESLPCSQERDFHLRLAAEGLRFQRIPEVLYTVRKLPGSLSSNSERVLRQHLSIARSLRDILEKKGTLTASRLRSIAAFLARDARILHRLGDPMASSEYFQEAQTLSPSGVIDAYGKWSQLLVRAIGPRGAERCLALLRRK